MNGSSSVLAPAGAPARAIAELSWVLIGGGAIVFAVVIGLLAWVVLRRGTRDRGGSSRGWLVGGGLVFPTVVLLALFAYGELRIAAQVPVRAADELVVSVTGRQWWWQWRYRDPESGQDIAGANEIHIPAGRTVVFGLNSGDVIHSFWVPSLAGKVDMIPGRVQQLRVRADRPGVHLGPCAEFCGDQHARMALHVVVDGAADFDRWLAAQAAPAAPPADPLAQRGLAVFAERRCAACHVVRGLFDVAAQGADAAPDLTHVASRRFLGAGTLRTDAAGFAQWVASVQHLKPGARMPSYGDIDAGSLAALAAFLEQLR